MNWKNLISSFKNTKKAQKELCRVPGNDEVPGSFLA
jgi:hypothetical protein